MGERLHPLAATLTLGLLVAVMLCSGPACIPPPISPGYISIPQNTKGKAVIQLMGCGAYEIANDEGYGAGALLFDPFVTERLSLPFGVSGGGGNGVGAAAARLGIRYRAASLLSLGGGIGRGVGGSAFSSAGSMFLDMELSLGGRWSIVGLSVSLRPTFEVVHGYFFSPVSIALGHHVLCSGKPVDGHGGRPRFVRRLAWRRPRVRGPHLICFSWVRGRWPFGVW